MTAETLSSQHVCDTLPGRDRRLVDLVESALVDPNLHTDLRLRLANEIAELLESIHDDRHASTGGDGRVERLPVQDAGLPAMLEAVLVDPNLHTDLRMRLHQEIPALVAQAQQRDRALSRSRLEIFDDIVCGIDGTRSCYEAVRQAASLAAPGGHLTLLAMTGERGEGKHQTAVLSPEWARRSLLYTRRLARGAHVQSTLELETDESVRDVLIRTAREHGLLALGAPSMSRLAHLLVGGIATFAAHEVPCSLLIARRPPAGRRFDQRIMVATDGNHTGRSDALVDLSIELAQARGASLILFHAAGRETVAHPTAIAAQSARARQALGDRCTVRVEAGRAHQLLLRTAVQEHASLIVLATRRVSGLRALGSVSERVVHRAPCSVLVIRPEDLEH